MRSAPEIRATYETPGANATRARQISNMDYDTFHPPPIALTKRTLALRRRPRISTAVLWLVSALVCATMTFS